MNSTLKQTLAGLGRFVGTAGEYAAAGPAAIGTSLAKVPLPLLRKATPDYNDSDRSSRFSPANIHSALRIGSGLLNPMGGGLGVKDLRYMAENVPTISDFDQAYRNPFLAKLFGKEFAETEGPAQWLEDFGGVMGSMGSRYMNKGVESVPKIVKAALSKDSFGSGAKALGAGASKIASDIGSNLKNVPYKHLFKSAAGGKTFRSISDAMGLPPIVGVGAEILGSILFGAGGSEEKANDLKKYGYSLVDESAEKIGVKTGPLVKSTDNLIKKTIGYGAGESAEWRKKASEFAKEFSERELFEQLYAKGDKLPFARLQKAEVPLSQVISLKKDFNKLIKKHPETKEFAGPAATDLGKIIKDRLEGASAKLAKYWNMSEGIHKAQEVSKDMAAKIDKKRYPFFFNNFMKSGVFRAGPDFFRKVRTSEGHAKIFKDLLNANFSGSASKLDSALRASEGFLRRDHLNEVERVGRSLAKAMANKTVNSANIPTLEQLKAGAERLF